MLGINGGSWELPPPFFQIAKKCATVFGTPYHTSFPHTLWKFQIRVTQGQVTRSRQVTSSDKKFECSSKLHRLNECLGTFNDWYSVTVSMKCIPQNFDMGGLRSGQFCDLSIISQAMGENWKRLFWTKTILKTVKYRITGRIDILNRKIAISGPSLLMTSRSLQFIKGHRQFFGNIFL